MERILSKVYLNNGIEIKEFIALIDTGASGSLISDNVLNIMNPDIYICR